MKFFSEYTRTVLSEVAVAIRGSPLGLGIDTQARELETGLNSASGRRRKASPRLGSAIVNGVNSFPELRLALFCWCDGGAENTSAQFCDKIVEIRLSELGDSAKVYPRFLIISLDFFGSFFSFLEYCRTRNRRQGTTNNGIIFAS